MKSLLLLIFTTLSFSNISAQHLTEHDVNGDPLSEIIDPNGMKQGEWKYYSHTGSIIRIENYLDNELLTRESIINKSLVITTQMNVLTLPDNLRTKLSQDTHSPKGEIITDATGEVIEIHFYTKVSSDIEEQLINVISTNGSKFINAIITF